MPDLLASKGGSCGWITSPCLGGVKVKSLFVAFGYRSHDFLPCPCKRLRAGWWPCLWEFDCMLSSPVDCSKLGFMMKGTHHVCPAFSRWVSPTQDSSQGLSVVQAVSLLEQHFWHEVMGHSEIPHSVLLLTADCFLTYFFCSPVHVHNQMCSKICPKKEMGTEE